MCEEDAVPYKGAIACHVHLFVKLLLLLQKKNVRKSPFENVAADRLRRKEKKREEKISFRQKSR